MFMCDLPELAWQSKLSQLNEGNKKSSKEQTQVKNY